MESLIFFFRRDANYAHFTLAAAGRGTKLVVRLAGTRFNAMGSKFVSYDQMSDHDQL